MTLPRKANERLRAVRLRMQSPSGSGLPMSRCELADLVNAHLASRDVGWLCMTANHIGKYETGQHIWPQREYREALCTVLGVDSDADLGFYTRRAVEVGSVTSAAAPGRSDRGGADHAANRCGHGPRDL